MSDNQKASYTPGPWEADDDNEGTVRVLMGSALKSRVRYKCHHSILICEEMPDGAQLAEAMANARLIAAAPSTTRRQDSDRTRTHLLTTARRRS